MFATLDLSLPDDNRHKRLKVGRACYTCRLKKIKCDGLTPCMQCKARRRPCTYSKDGQDDGLFNIPQSPGADSDSQDPIGTGYEGIFSEVGEPTTSGSPTYSDDRRHVSTLTSEKRVDPKTKSIVDVLARGLYELTIHSDPTNASKITPDNTIALHGEIIRSNPEPPLPLVFIGTADLPAKELQQRLVEYYFRYRHLYFPIIYKKTFLRQFQGRDGVSPLLMNMVLAHGAKYTSDPLYRSDPDDPFSHGDMFFDRAKSLLDDFLDAPRLTTVQALLLMATYEHGLSARSRRTRAWMYGGMAFRMCLDLGINKRAGSDERLNRTDAEWRKRVFWGCYILDKLHSVETERPWMLFERDMNVELPSSDMEEDEDEKRVIDGYTAMAKLMQLCEKMLAFVSYGQKKSPPGTTTHDQYVITLDNELTHWLLSLPAHLRWTPGSESGDEYSLVTSPFVAYLHMNYNMIVLALFRCFVNTTNKAFHQRCNNMATNITQLLATLAAKPTYIFTVNTVSYCAINAAIIHAINVSQDEPKFSQQSAQLFGKTVSSLRNILQHQDFVSVDKGIKLIDQVLLVDSSDSGNLSLFGPDSSIGGHDYDRSFYPTTSLSQGHLSQGLFMDNSGERRPSDSLSLAIATAVTSSPGSGPSHSQSPYHHGSPSVFNFSNEFNAAFQIANNATGWAPHPLDPQPSQSTGSNRKRPNSNSAYGPYSTSQESGSSPFGNSQRPDSPAEISTPPSYTHYSNHHHHSHHHPSHGGASSAQDVSFISSVAASATGWVDDDSSGSGNDNSPVIYPVRSNSFGGAQQGQSHRQHEGRRAVMLSHGSNSD